MIESRHISKFIVFLMAAACILCFIAMLNTDRLDAMMGGPGVTMEYESKLFDTDEVMDINIIIDEDALARIAYAWALGLSVHDDGYNEFGVCSGVDIHMTVACTRLDNRNR